MPAEQLVLFVLNVANQPVPITQLVFLLQRNGFTKPTSRSAIDRLGTLGLVRSVGGVCLEPTRRGRWRRNVEGDSAGVHDGEARA